MSGYMEEKKGVILECQEKYRKNQCMRSTKQKKEICADRGKKGTRKILNLIKQKKKQETNKNRTGQLEKTE